MLLNASGAFFNLKGADVEKLYILKFKITRHILFPFLFNNLHRYCLILCERTFTPETIVHIKRCGFNGLLFINFHILLQSRSSSSTLNIPLAIFFFCWFT